jgi:hypothetical protein
MLGILPNQKMLIESMVWGDSCGMGDLLPQGQSAQSFAFHATQVGFGRPIPLFPGHIRFIRGREERRRAGMGM